jgi:Family of unknown function (DUF6262)
VTRADNAHHLRRSAAARHDAALVRARAALDELDRAGQPLTFATVARAARVSRSWLYNQPDLRATITRLRSAASLTDAPPIPAAQRATSESLHQRLDATRDEITQLRAENAVLRDRLARSLGDQRSRR